MKVMTTPSILLSAVLYGPDAHGDRRAVTQFQSALDRDEVAEDVLRVAVEPLLVQVVSQIPDRGALGCSHEVLEITVGSRH